MLLRLAAGGAVAGTAAAYAWARRELGEDGLSRIYAYDRVAVPAIIEYKLLEARCEKLPALLPFLFSRPSDEEERARFQVLHDKWVGPLYDVHMSLGGFYYKSAQKVASNQGGVVPKTYIDYFQPFLNDIPPHDFNEVVAVVEGELGAPIDSVFSSFDREPIGCASIGQAHRATLRSTGERVVAKVRTTEHGAHLPNVAMLTPPSYGRCRTPRPSAPSAATSSRYVL